MTNIQHLVKLLTNRGIEFTSEEGEFVDVIETENEELSDSIKQAEQDLEDAEHNYEEAMNSKESEVSNLQDEVDRLSCTNIIELSGGTLLCDISGLNYFTKESFKEWCMKHAITNSEPVFNL